MRVSEGGHNVDEEIIERRYRKGIKNLFDIYLPIVDGALIFDNSEGKHGLMVRKTVDGHIKVIKFNELKHYYGYHS